MSTSTIELSKPVLIGAGGLLLLSLFFAAADSGKEERAKQTQLLTEIQQKVTGLENKIADQEAQLRQQSESVQIAHSRLEIAEETMTRLRTRTDEAERQLATLRKANAASTHKPALSVAPAKAPIKTNTTAKKPAPAPVKR